ncbi:hypothetical protein CALVIDRAFT_534319 [Calocera viscosa TUFC12733]|uniref:Uncharacterized protein n=1 Tax=Calocera viscosa (strain TUFC12733) TaxID=1330018 RepID=A0A167Q2M7_CALVF|nr:hypothetical protein CALVIDRAFT_534319 [Calocera viscosa TUFC12733]
MCSICWRRGNTRWNGLGRETQTDELAISRCLMALWRFGQCFIHPADAEALQSRVGKLRCQLAGEGQLPESLVSLRQTYASLRRNELDKAELLFWKPLKSLSMLRTRRAAPSRALLSPYFQVPRTRLPLRSSPWRYGILLTARQRRSQESARSVLLCIGVIHRHLARQRRGGQTLKQGSRSFGGSRASPAEEVRAQKHIHENPLIDEFGQHPYIGQVVNAAKKRLHLAHDPSEDGHSRFGLQTTPSTGTTITVLGTAQPARGGQVGQ